MPSLFARLSVVIQNPRVTLRDGHWILHCNMRLYVNLFKIVIQKKKCINETTFYFKKGTSPSFVQLLVKNRAIVFLARIWVIFTDNVSTGKKLYILAFVFFLKKY